MSGTGVPTFELADAKNLKLGIVASRWHTTICDALVANAEQTARDAGCRRHHRGPRRRCHGAAGGRAGAGPQP